MYLASDNQLRVWQRCRMEWWLRYIAQLDTSSNPTHLAFGDAWGLIMNRWWAAWVSRGSIPLGDDASEIAEDVYQPIVSAAGDPFAALDGPRFATAEEAKAARRQSVFLIRWYARNWQREWESFAPTAVQSEIHLERPVRSPDASPSRVTAFRGYIDKLVLSNGEWWIIDHKSTGQPLSRWTAIHAEDPQLLRYVWLAQAHVGRRVAGVIFDLIHTKPPPLVREFKVVKGGTRLSKVLPAGTTAAILKQACLANGFDPSTGWYAERIRALGGQERPEYSMIDVRRYSALEVERAGFDLYTLSSEVRHAAKHRWRTHRVQASRGWDEEKLRDLMPALWNEAAQHVPRSHDACFRYGKPCPMLQACKSGNVDGYVRRESR